MKRLISYIILALCATSAFGQAEVVRLYEGRAPGCENWTQQEFLFEYTTPMNPGEVGQCMKVRYEICFIFMIDKTRKQ